jgi:hypothetical protein
MALPPLPQLFIYSRSWPNANSHMSGITKIINPDRDFDGITSNIDFQHALEVRIDHRDLPTGCCNDTAENPLQICRV